MNRDISGTNTPSKSIRKRPKRPKTAANVDRKAHRPGTSINFRRPKTASAKDKNKNIKRYRDCNMCRMSFPEEVLCGVASWITVQRIIYDFINQFKTVTKIHTEMLPDSWNRFCKQYERNCTTQLSTTIPRMYAEVRICPMCSQFVPHNPKMISVSIYLT